MIPEIASEGIRFVLGPELLSSAIGLVTILLVSLIEKVSKKFKPWSWLFGKIGKLINKNVESSLNSLIVRVENLEESNKRQDAVHEEALALAARRHIIAAADELKNGARHYDTEEEPKKKISHSEEWFNSVLEDITGYEKYCDTHPNFKNEKAVASIRFIRKAYDYVYENNLFL